MPSNYERTYGVNTVSASTLTVTPGGYVGQPIILSAAGAQTVTLPAASGSGNKYTFIGSADATGDHKIQVANASDIMMGIAVLGNDAAGASCFYTADTSDTITLNGSTKGGYKGWRVTLIDIAANTWQVEVVSEASGTEATPFSAAVS